MTLPSPPKYGHWLKGTPGAGGLHGWLELIPPALADLESRSGTSVTLVDNGDGTATILAGTNITNNNDGSATLTVA